MPFSAAGKAILADFEAQNTKIIAVTKYLAPESIFLAWERLKTRKNVLGIGENRVERCENLVKMGFPREKIHFIGQISSRKIPKIVKNAQFCHSVAKISHLETFLSQKSDISLFFQVNISKEAQKNGILPRNFANFHEKAQTALKKYQKEENWLGLSAMGRFSFQKSEKLAEIKEMQAILKNFCPKKAISAGTSADFGYWKSEKDIILRLGRVLWADFR